MFFRNEIFIQNKDYLHTTKLNTVRNAIRAGTLILETLFTKLDTVQLKKKFLFSKRNSNKKKIGQRKRFLTSVLRIFKCDFTTF